MIGEKEVCQDIVSDAFEQTWLFSQKNPSFNQTSYMYSLVRNKCVDYIRHETAKAHYADFYMHMFSESDEGDTSKEMEEQIAQNEEDIDDRILWKRKNQQLSCGVKHHSPRKRLRLKLRWRNCSPHIRSYSYHRLLIQRCD